MTPVELDNPFAMTLMSLLLSITLIVPPLLDPTKILPESLSAICLGVTIFSAKISIEKPFSIFRFLMSFEESEKTFEEKDIINSRCKKNL